MSKLRNRIRDVGRAPGGIGFTALAQRERPRHVLVIAWVSTPEEASAVAALGAGGIVVSSPTMLPSVTPQVDLPVGVHLDDAGIRDVESASEGGADFFIFDDARTHASALTHPQMGRVLVLGPDQHEERLRAVAAIDLDAVIVDATPGPISVRDQIELRRVVTLTGAPLLIRCAEAPDMPSLTAWRDAGAPAVLVPAVVTERALAAAAEVPAPIRRPRTGEMPALGAPPVPHEHDDEDGWSDESS